MLVGLMMGMLGILIDELECSIHVRRLVAHIWSEEKMIGRSK